MEILKVTDPGIYTSIQDEGRRGYRRFGVPLSGAMDPYAYSCCNRILGNPPGYPAVEVTGPGFSCVFSIETKACITGADINPRLNGNPIETGQAFYVKKGDELAFTCISTGLRAYLNTTGGLTAGELLGSSSMEKGCRLNAGEVLIQHGAADNEPSGSFDNSYIRIDGEYIIRIRRGLDNTGKIKEEYTVSTYHDRMGIRLTGGNQKSIGSIVSKPLFPGCIQLPGDGNPIIIMNDGQTTGGYPVTAVIVEEDMKVAGQLKAGDKVKFSYVK